MEFEVDEVVVVPNDRAPRPSHLDERAVWLMPERNLGYGDAFNLAIQARSSPAYVLLNTDVLLPRGTLEACLETLGAEGVGVVGPVLRHADGSLQSGAARLTRFRRSPHVLVDPGRIASSVLG